MANIPVKWFDYRMAGFPNVSGDQRATAGVVVTVLDAVLVDGFNTLTVDSIVVSNSVATVTRSTGLVFLQHQVIEIAGATPSGLNGQWRVKTANGVNSLTFDCPGVSDGAATGTITIKTPGLGWQKAFTATNRRVYRSQNTSSPRSYYDVTDTDTSGYKTPIACNASMTDINTPVGQWANLNNSEWCIYRPSAYAPIGNKNPTFVVGDDRTVWFVWQANGWYGNHYYAQGFGDYTSFLLNDAENEFVAGGNPNFGAYYHPQSVHASVAVDVSGKPQRILRKSSLGVVGPRFYGVGAGNMASGFDSGGLPWPSSVHNEIVITDTLIREVGTGGNPLRGKHRGMYHCMTATPLADQYEVQLVEDVAGLEGRRCAVLYMLTSTDVANQTTAGRVVFDLTGPW